LPALFALLIQISNSQRSARRLEPVRASNKRAGFSRFAPRLVKASVIALFLCGAGYAVV
jgi:hypothetical protein